MMGWRRALLLGVGLAPIAVVAQWILAALLVIFWSCYAVPLNADGMLLSTAIVNVITGAILCTFIGAALDLTPARLVDDPAATRQACWALVATLASAIQAVNIGTAMVAHDLRAVAVAHFDGLLAWACHAAFVVVSVASVVKLRPGADALLKTRRALCIVLGVALAYVGYTAHLAVAVAR